jgi:hypothetical protein
MMMIFDITEWIANFLMLGFALCIWCVGFFLLTLIFYAIKDGIFKLTNKE